MTTPPHDDWLEAMLESQQPYLDDAGFTARVLAALPSPRARATWWRTAVLLGPVAIGAAVALFGFGGGETLWQAARALTQGIVVWSAVPAATVALFVAVAVCAYSAFEDA